MAHSAHFLHFLFDILRPHSVIFLEHELPSSLNRAHPHECEHVPVGRQRNGKFEEGTKQDADAEDPLGAEPLCQDATDELRGDVAEGEAAEHQALHLSVPVEAIFFFNQVITLFHRTFIPDVGVG